MRNTPRGERLRHALAALATTCAFLFALLPLVPVVALADETAPEASGGQTASISIMYTSDTHGYYAYSEGKTIGFAALAALKAELQPDLLLDAGDTFHGQSFATVAQGKSTLELMAAVGYDAMTPGNHDWSYGAAALDELAGGSVPMVADNVSGLSNDKDFVIKTVTVGEGADAQKIRVAVVGAFDEKLADHIAAKNLEGVTLHDAAQGAGLAAWVARTAGRADVVVLLTHSTDPVGLVSRIYNVSPVFYADAVVAGHEHLVFDKTVTATDGREIPVVEAGSHFETVGLLKLNLTKDEEGDWAVSGHTVTNYTAADLAGYAEKPEAQHVAALTKELEESNKQILAEPVGTATGTYEYSWEAVRSEGTQVGALVAAAYLDQTGADVALENAGGIRSGIKPGTVTAGDVLAISPYGNTLDVYTMSGADLLSVLEDTLELRAACNDAWTQQKEAAAAGMKYDEYFVKYPFPSSSGSVLAFGGVTLVVDKSAPNGARILSATIGDKPVEADATYRVAMNSYIPQLTDVYSGLKNISKVSEHGTCEQALRAFVASEGWEEKVAAVAGQEQEGQAVATLATASGTRSFSTFDEAAEALADVSGEAVLTLAQDATFSKPFEVPADASVTLDLNGHALTGASGIYNIESGIAPITVSGSLTIKDSTERSAQSAATGAPKNVLTTEGRIKVTGSLTLESGNVVIDATKAGEGIVVGSADAPGGSYVQTGGSLQVGSPSDEAYVDGIVNYGSVRIEGGTVLCTVMKGSIYTIVNRGKLDVSAGNIYGLAGEPDDLTSVCTVENYEGASAVITGGQVVAGTSDPNAEAAGYAGAIRQQGGTVSLGKAGAREQSLRISSKKDGIALLEGSLEVADGVYLEAETGYGIKASTFSATRVSVSIRNSYIGGAKGALYSECTVPGACVVEDGAILASEGCAPVATGAGARASVVLKGGSYLCQTTDKDVAKSSLESLKRYLADGSGDVTGYGLSFVEGDCSEGWRAQVVTSDSATVRPPLEVGDTPLHVTFADGVEHPVLSLAEAFEAVREKGNGVGTVTITSALWGSGEVVVDEGLDVTLVYGENASLEAEGEGLHFKVLGKLTIETVDYSWHSVDASFEVGSEDGSTEGELVFKNVKVSYADLGGRGYAVLVHKGATCRAEDGSRLEYINYAAGASERLAADGVPARSAAVVVDGDFELTGSTVRVYLDKTVDASVNNVSAVWQRGGHAVVKGSEAWNSTVELAFYEDLSEEDYPGCAAWTIDAGELKVSDTRFWSNGTYLLMRGGSVELAEGTGMIYSNAPHRPPVGVLADVAPGVDASLRVTGGAISARRPFVYAEGSRTDVIQLMGGAIGAVETDFDLKPFLADGYEFAEDEKGRWVVSKSAEKDPDPEPGPEPGEKEDPEVKPDPEPGEGEEDPGETDPGDKGDGSGDQGTDPDQPADQDAPSKKPLVPNAGDATALLLPGLLAASGLGLVIASKRRR